MSLTKKISQLKNLAELQPNKKWEDTTKYDLLSEISAQNRLMKAQKLTNSEKVDLFVSRVMRRTVPSVSKVIAGFLIIMMGSGVGFAAQASVPGEVLWPIKRSIEKAELTVTLSPVRETEVHIKHVNKRLAEIDKIVKDLNKTDQPGQTVKSEKAIKKAVGHLEQDVTAVDTSLKIVKEEKKPVEAVSLAKKVKDATKETKNKVSSLEEANKSKNAVFKEALNDVKKFNEEAKESAVNLAVEVHEEVESAMKKSVIDQEISTNSTTPQTYIEERDAQTIKNLVTEIIASEIDDLSSEIKNTKEKVDVAGEEQENNTDASVGQQEDLTNINSIKSKPGAAEVVLDEAKVLLGEGALKDALNKVSESKEINSEAETVLEQISNNKQAENKDSIDSGQTASTTPADMDGNLKEESETVEASAVGIDEVELKEVELEEPVVDDSAVTEINN
ncbi:MAG: hypothetical protein COV55_01095 [Candidatus Komeilibacteria bacterium CG11_big_fil_rev_8_21_14_0_20_36_20]|uniref:DUF5667 domain-containing protein n=1 Tax=Candidatus Komeilibacteria bacterium CG11_big_fil_rev_8_21_14_0_20_36_20 TaxID=1974477 RepID=A0A2H0NFR8_9BACT|nr:MAG: hypothetical protein COV55_01095 [Candidatus Komeilibacteria bacterium CG11_big_fil_rev_8_21_14_0_20_36_20]PIR81376.1 MAG: hypothetical protein COU21_04065 [Candidatus Komeilibacteria bacterium CG10_big_fil_rev_8_21_14_0_10_36_65]PJC55101.1 MAG: hypothetical protein CO027_03020 [Candidatus Komeilibacteria bacterium CG_4_9_14_0_2_um_filter_36_13]